MMHSRVISVPREYRAVSVADHSPATQTQGFAPPPGPPPATQTGPPLPVRRETNTGQAAVGPQPDDLEDVKKVCDKAVFN
jgi:hypothetical protein